VSDLHDLTLLEFRDRLAAREISAEEGVNACLDRIESLDDAESGVHAFLQTFPSRARQRARAIDQRVASEGAASVGPLAGVPVAVKDNMCTDYGRTTCASRILETYESPFTATAVRLLEEAGAIVLGKTNLDEFAMGSSNEHSAFGPTRNPWDDRRAPGGSSGGSAAAVAARMTPLALGSDTGGSIRQPAAHCGVVGVKPTYGRVSRWGLVAFASSLDQIGPLTRSVADAALALDVICAHDPRDATSAHVQSPRLLDRLDEPVEGLRIGVPASAASERNHPGVAAAFEHARQALASRGVEFVDLDMPTVEQGIAAYYVVAPAEASSNLARYDGVRYGRRADPNPGDDLVALYARSRAEGFGDEVKRRIMLGTFALSAGYYDAYYNTALKVRRLIRTEFDRAFAAPSEGGAGVHTIMLPSTSGPAFRIGEKLDDPLTMYLEDVYTVPANLAGLPGISLPAALVEEDGASLPVGVQLLGAAFDESTLLRAARTLEGALDWNHSPSAL